jgi:antitoxin CptB
MSDDDRIRWRCRRGMLELDLVLNAFLERHLCTLDARKLEVFCTLLERPDPELLDYVMGHNEPGSAEECEMIALLRNVNVHLTSYIPSTSPALGNGEARFLGASG